MGYAMPILFFCHIITLKALRGKRKQKQIGVTTRRTHREKGDHEYE